MNYVDVEGERWLDLPPDKSGIAPLDERLKVGIVGAQHDREAADLNGDFVAQRRLLRLHHDHC
jgi:hypothetical protein